MADLRPFHGTRFTAKAGELKALVAPPYDVISPTEREALAGQNPHNVVLLTLPESEEGDRSKFVKYARSSSRLEQWIQSGAMAVEPEQSFYRYLQTFTTPDGARIQRQCMIALIKVEPYENGVVLPHEQTFPKHKEDRLRILEATRSHLECIYGLYEDSDQGIYKAVAEAPGEIAGQFVSDDGIEHRFEVVNDSESLNHLVTLFKDKKIWIADGHHRYETALAFRQAAGGATSPIAEDYMMMALSSMEDPGLVLLPTHRILNRDPGDLRARLQAPYWTIEDCPNGNLLATIEAINSSGQRAFGIALPGGSGFVLRIANLDQVVNEISGDSSTELKSLDVTILHEVIFAKHLGMTGLDFFGYTRIEQEALDAVDNGAFASFLMNPPSVHDMRVIANGGEKMPQKSTYYHPKITSGLVLWRLSDF
ncbi:MAG: DUF1015 domain-containing protein [Chthonomonas sp.]|nr:DUF1015 domain-containing protein [Chthonomonas sp.]